MRLEGPCLGSPSLDLGPPREFRSRAGPLGAHVRAGEGEPNSAGSSRVPVLFGSRLEPKSWTHEPRSMGPPNLEDEVNLREIKLKWKNKEAFSEKQSWPDQLDGSYVTYGWVLIFRPSEVRKGCRHSCLWRDSFRDLHLGHIEGHLDSCCFRGLSGGSEVYPERDCQQGPSAGNYLFVVGRVLTEGCASSCALPVTL